MRLGQSPSETASESNCLGEKNLKKNVLPSIHILPRNGEIWKKDIIVNYKNSTEVRTSSPTCEVKDMND